VLRTTCVHLIQVPGKNLSWTPPASISLVSGFGMKNGPSYTLRSGAFEQLLTSLDVRHDDYFSLKQELNSSETSCDNLGGEVKV
jgi:hypothetical protein